MDVNPASSDRELLRSYREQGSQEAFAALVSRHVDKVYSAALRQTHDPHQAQDVTQIVFMAFARKSATIGPSVVVAGWLITATYFAAKSLRKTEARRVRHEHRAAVERTVSMNRADEVNVPLDPTETASLWGRIEPLLDHALQKLSPRARDAIVLRFLESRDYRSIGIQMGTTEEAARKRVERALRCLRTTFQAHGAAVLSMDILGAALLTHAVHYAPLGVASSTAITAASAHQTAVLKGAITLMAWSKTKLIAACAAAVVFTGGTGALVYHQVSKANESEREVVIASTTISSATKASPQPSGQFVLSGKVQKADGSPLVGGAVLASVDDGRFLELGADPKWRIAASAPQGITGDDGAFEIQLSAKPMGILVSAPEGCVRASVEDLAKSSTLVLEPWGKLECRLSTANGPAPKGTDILLSSGFQRKGVRFEMRASTNEAGEFSLTRVPPGEHVLFAMGQNGRFRVEPGQTAKLTIEEPRGSSLVGYLKGAPSGQPVTILVNPALRPLRVLDAGVFYLDALQFNLPPTEDGKFQLYHLAPGEYTLSVSVSTVSGSNLRNIKWWHAETKATIPPEGSGGDSVDIGVLEVKPLR